MSCATPAQFLPDELHGNVFQGVDGFHAKYFKNTSWSPAIQDKTRDTESADALEQLFADVLGLTHQDGLAKWLAKFQSIYFPATEANFHLRSESIDIADTSFVSSIYLETSEVIPGSIRVFGQYHHSNSSVTTEDDVGSTLRKCLEFCDPFTNRILSCVATAPLGCLIQKYASISELLAALCDITKALRSLYVDGRMLHRDVAIKNLVITSQHSINSPKGTLIDFDQALDLDNVRAIEPLVGSDGFMAVGILFGQPHAYRHDIESLFFVFLWLAIGNDHENDDANDILEGLPKSSRLWKWCSMDFFSVGKVKLADMSPEGFSGILDEFSADFAFLRDLAKTLHELIFPIRDGKIFTGTEIEQVAVERLYDGIADAFNQSALSLRRKHSCNPKHDKN